MKLQSDEEAAATAPFSFATTYRPPSCRILINPVNSCSTESRERIHTAGPKVNYTYVTKEEIRVRPATLPDAKILAHLWFITFPDKFGPVLGHNAKRVIYDWLRLSERHLQTTTVAEIEGSVIGFIVLESPTAPRPDDGRWLWQALQLHNGILGSLRGLLLMLLIDRHYPGHRDEVFIEMLGVAPALRGRGVAHRLMQHAEALARAQNINRLTLTVVSTNAPAIHLYRKLGFKTRSEQHSRLLKWITGHSGYYEMEKQLRM